MRAIIVIACALLAIAGCTPLKPGNDTRDAGARDAGEIRDAAHDDAGPDAGPVICPELAPPQNGRVAPATGGPNTVAQYFCDLGFVLTGNDDSSTRTCLPSGAWTGSDPVCDAVRGPCDPNPCMNAGTCTEDGDSFTCECAGTGYSGATCATPIECTGAIAPANGTVSAGSASYPSSVTYACDEGYTLEGASSSQCLADGSFSSGPPTCGANACAETLSAPANGSVDPASGVTGDEVTYSCDAGYALSASATRTCLPSGAWSESAPACVGNPCADALSAPAHGSVNRTSGGTGDVATYSCDAGYTLSGSATQTCEASGNWSESAPSCTPNACVDTLTPPANGWVDPTTGATGDVATYTCAATYSLIGTATRTCEATGAWSGSEPTCGMCSADRWCWENPLPQGNGLLGVWGSSATDVWAVGQYGTILRWNGSAWSSVSSGTTNWLNGVWGSSASDVWAVGDGGTILRWNGSAWSSVSSGTTDVLWGVWGSSASDVWAVGDRGTVVRWDGSAWSAVSSGTTVSLRAVWGSSASDVWAVGDGGTILRWSGSAWSSEVSGTENTLSAVWGSSASDVWAVGAYRAVRWDGSSWANGTTWAGIPGGAPDSANGVWGSSSTIWIATLSGIWRWGDGEWTMVGDGLPTGSVAIWGSSPSDIVAVGIGGSILHSDGGASTRVSTGSDVLGLRDVWGSSATDVWAVGWLGTIVHSNGTAWTPRSSGTTLELRALSGISESDVWAVGRNGTIVHWDGSTWTSVPSGTTVSLSDVWGSSANDAWAVGEGGTILRWDGSAWAVVPSGTGMSLRGVWGSSATDVWAVGESGTILRWDGSIWTSVPSGTMATFVGVWGSSATDVWAFSDSSTHRWNGGEWSGAYGGPVSALSGLWGNSATDVWAVGAGGGIQRWTGSEWTRVSSGTDNTLRGVWGSSANDVWVVGEYGTILHHHL